MRKINGFTIIEPGDEFPDPAQGPGDNPLAFGRDLTAALMLKAYHKGIFAWSNDPVSWWSPDPRAIIGLNDLYVSTSLARKIRKRTFRVTLDFAFEHVVAGCATPRYTDDETWISPEFYDCFRRLHYSGYAHSIECWQDNQLAGGVFGVAVGGLFSAESMFHSVTDASKVALYYLVETLKQAQFSLLDIQVLTPHTRSLGARSISRGDYLRLLAKALKTSPLPLGRQVIVE